jgi:uncharacterized membrane protein
MLQALAKYFFRGLFIVGPAAVTFFVLYVVIVKVDGWIDVTPLVGRRVPGLGLMLTVAAITLAGFLATNFITRWVFGTLERLVRHLPLVELLYTSLKDLIGAFVGERKRFDKPVVVALGEGSETGLLGFLTREDLAELGAPGSAAVYVPQSYNFAGNLIVVPRSRVRPLPVDSKTMMAFIVSGGVSGSGLAEEAPSGMSLPRSSV